MAWPMNQTPIWYCRRSAKPATAHAGPRFSAYHRSPLIVGPSTQSTHRHGQGPRRWSAACRGRPGLRAASCDRQRFGLDATARRTAVRQGALHRRHERDRVHLQGPVHSAARVAARAHVDPGRASVRGARRHAAGCTGTQHAAKHAAAAPARPSAITCRSLAGRRRARRARRRRAAAAAAERGGRASLFACDT